VSPPDLPPPLQQPRRQARGAVRRLVWPRSELGRLRRLLALAAALLLLAWINPPITLRQSVIEWVAVIDVTQSMAVSDMVELDASGRARPQSRLDFARARLSEALRELPCGMRLGLGVFTAHRSILLMEPVEVCDNYAELKAAIARIDHRMGWQGNSEIAKGLDSGLLLMRDLPDQPALAFFTDGQEAPPISPSYRPPLHVERGQAQALLIGVGGDKLLPIPKVDPAGRISGHWQAGEVMQQDLRSLGRDGHAGGQTYVDDPKAPAQAAGVAPVPGATPGREHLSSLREAYLQLLAEELGLDYLRLVDTPTLAAALSRSKFGRPQAAPLSLRGGLALAGLLLLVLIYRPAWPPRWRVPAWASRPHR
jgi:mxaL protein